MLRFIVAIYKSQLWGIVWFKFQKTLWHLDFSKSAVGVGTTSNNNQKYSIMSLNKSDSILSTLSRKIFPGCQNRWIDTSTLPGHCSHKAATDSQQNNTMPYHIRGLWMMMQLKCIAVCRKQNKTMSSWHTDCGGSGKSIPQTVLLQQGRYYCFCCNFHNPMFVQNVFLKYSSCGKDLFNNYNFLTIITINMQCSVSKYTEAAFSELLA